MATQPCPQRCSHPCSYNSPPRLIKDWCPHELVPKISKLIGLTIRASYCHACVTYCCHGPCACSDVYWEDILADLEQPIFCYESKLENCEDPTELHLDFPDLEEIAENSYWYYKDALSRRATFCDISCVPLPPCMHRMYAHIDSIHTKWEQKKRDLIVAVKSKKRKTTADNRADRLHMEKLKKGAELARTAEKNLRQAIDVRDELNTAIDIARRHSIEFNRFLDVNKKRRLTR